MHDLARALSLSLVLVMPATALMALPPVTAPAPAVERPAPEALKQMELRDSDGASLGRITDVVRAGSEADGVSHVLVALGGFMGMGAHTVAVPYSELRLREDRKTGADFAVLPWTEEQLRSVPPYNPADPASLGLVGAEAAGNDVGMTGTAQPNPEDPLPEITPAQS
ncbi:PRC-barrel domain-containing protein [Frigidibacter sp. MR17.14]|uniref:PRC-barrel domain-containing protein n=1 Tax=Frigidibacter sp. MR17.14 TaxID=3126509 RepID=UPI003012F612